MKHVFRDVVGKCVPHVSQTRWESVVVGSYGSGVKDMMRED